jgi:hypothetical protein
MHDLDILQTQESRTPAGGEAAVRDHGSLGADP